MKTSLKKRLKINIVSLSISIISTIFIIGTSLLIYYFSKGYRVNIFEREITKTGVLTAQTEPSSATLYINGDDVGRTPRSRTLETGIYNISIWKNGYREWKKDVNILEEKSTPIYPFLILENIEKTTVWESEGTLEKYWISKYNDYYIFLQKNADETYSLYQYRVNTPLWNFNPNPMQILTTTTNNIELNISPNGQLAIMDIESETGIKKYLIELQKLNSMENITPLDLLDSTNYNITWAKDNRFLILESAEDIISFDTLKSIRYLLVKKIDVQSYIWTTDEEGFFYIVDPLNTDEDNTYIYALKQLKLDGTDTKYTIEKAYFQKDSRYVEHYRNNGETYPEFKNSPESTQTTGQIIFFDVNQEAKGVYIETDTSTYWYDITRDRYRMISPYSAELIQFSPDSKKLLFANGNNIYVFTFDKEEADHTEDIGSKKVDNLLKDEVHDINWLSNSSYVYYIKDNTFFISEKDGGNIQDIFKLDNILLSSIKNSRKQIVTLEQGDKFTINQYEIN